MAIFMTKSHMKRGKKSYSYLVLKEGFWDRDAKAQRQRYIAYVGTKPTITREKAKKICEDKGVEMSQLEAVSGLEIVDGE